MKHASCKTPLLIVFSDVSSDEDCDDITEKKKSVFESFQNALQSEATKLQMRLAANEKMLQQIELGICDVSDQKKIHSLISENLDTLGNFMKSDEVTIQTCFNTFRDFMACLKDKNVDDENILEIVLGKFKSLNQENCESLTVSEGGTRKRSITNKKDPFRQHFIMDVYENSFISDSFAVDFEALLATLEPTAIDKSEWLELDADSGKIIEIFCLLKF